MKQPDPNRPASLGNSVHGEHGLVLPGHADNNHLTPGHAGEYGDDAPLKPWESFWIDLGGEG